MKDLTKKELMSLEIVTNPSGFTIWIGKGNSRRWVIDGSTIKETGSIDLGNQNSKYFGISNQNIGNIVLKKK